MTSGPGGGAASRFAPRRIPLAEAAGLARETFLLLARSPGRIASLALLLGALEFLPALGVRGFPGMLAGAIVATILETGLFRALEAAQQGRPPGLADVGAVFLLPPRKYLLLVIAGAVPFLCVLAAWWFDWGPDAMADWASAPAGPDGLRPPIPDREELLRAIVGGLASLPLFFLQPLVILRDWDASRTLSGALIAAAANGPWIFLATVADLVAGRALESLSGPGAGVAVDTAVLLALVFLGVLVNAFTYVLLQRSLR